jgi:hypothetical protein
MSMKSAGLSVRALLGTSWLDVPGERVRGVLAAGARYRYHVIELTRERGQIAKQ